MNTTIELIQSALITISAIASAVAVWQAKTISTNTLNFQKKLSSNQNNIYLLQSTISHLIQLKHIINNPLATDDHLFNSHQEIESRITKNLELLAEKKENATTTNTTQIDLNHRPYSTQEIDLKIKLLEGRLFEIYK